MPVWADVLIAVGLALVFAVLIGAALEAAKAKAMEAAVRPQLEEMEKVRQAMRALMRPNRRDDEPPPGGPVF